MSIDRTIKRAARFDEEKVVVNFKVPKSLKQEFEKVCEKYGMSMSSFFVSAIEDALRHEGIIDEVNSAMLADLYTEFTKLNKELEHYIDIVETEKNGGTPVPSSGTFDNPYDMRRFGQITQRIAMIEKIFAYANTPKGGEYVQQ